MLVAIAAVERIIGDQHIHVGGTSQRFRLLADDPRTQQQKESAQIVWIELRNRYPCPWSFSSIHFSELLSGKIDAVSFMTSFRRGVICE